MRQGVKALVWAGVVVALAWQVRQQDTSLIRWLAPLLHAQAIAAKDGAVTVSQSELDLALQQYVWRRGENLESVPSTRRAEARSTVLRDLLDQKLVRRARSQESPPSALPEVQAELSWFARMLGFDAGRREAALDAGLHSEASFEQAIRESLLDEHWLNRKVRTAPSSDRVLEWYEANRDHLRVPAAFRAAHLFLSRHELGKPDRSAEMRQLATQLTQGADWSVLVSEHSEDERTRRRAGDLGWFTENRMPADFMAVVKPMSPGQVSPAVQTTLGWHIIKLLEVKPARVPDLVEVRAEIEAMLGNQAIERAWPAVLAP